MTASFQEILHSRLFKFIVGETVDSSPTEFQVHEEAIAQLSKPLRTMMKGGVLTESRAACVTWANVSKETFERFSQFAYTGDYSIPKMDGRIREDVVAWKDIIAVEVDHYDVPEVPEPETPPDEDDFGFGFSRLSKKERLKKENLKKEMARERLERPSPIYLANFESLSIQLLAPRTRSDCEPAEHFDRDLSYSNAFLGHASLYVLGDYQLIDSLKALSLFKLHKTLCTFQLEDGNAEDIIDLARYAYSEEGGGGGFEGGIGGLRGLVCQYMATNALVLSLNDGFMKLLDEGGQFVQDFVKLEVQRTN